MAKMMDFLQPLLKPVDKVRGIAGFLDWKFYAVFLLYAASFLVLIRDPFFLLRGEVTFQQGMITLLMAIVLLNTVFWDLQLFGKPSGANLFLQFLAYLPGGIWVARIFGQATKIPEVTFWSVYIKGPIVSFVDEYFPAWIVDMVSNWKITVVFVLLLVVLSLRMRLQFKVAAIFLFLLVPFLTEISSGKSSVYLLGGTILFFAGLCLQFCRYDKVFYFEQIDSKLHQVREIDVLLLNCVMRIMTRLYEEGSLSDQAVKKITADVYNGARDPNNGYNEFEISQMAVCVTKEMIYNLNLATIQQTADGIKLYPNPHLFVGDDILRGLAVWPRVLATLFFAIVWAISPIDIIPDATPIIGTLDDVLVCALTTVMIGSTVMQENEIGYLQKIVRKN